MALATKGVDKVTRVEYHSMSKFDVKRVGLADLGNHSWQLCAIYTSNTNERWWVFSRPLAEPKALEDDAFFRALSGEDKG